MPKILVAILLTTATISTEAGAQQKSAAPRSAGSLSSIIERVRPSIVRILVMVDYRVQESTDTFKATASGTGFIVDTAGHIATAGHVVSLPAITRDLRGMLAGKNQHLIESAVHRTEIQVRLPARSIQKDANGNTFYNVNDILDARVVADDDTVDIAVLACDRNPLTLPGSVILRGKPLRAPARVPILQTHPPDDGNMISVSGFPLDIPVLVTNTGWIASGFFKDERGRALYLGDISVNHCNSGGPVYNDSDGTIIGVVTEYRPAPEGNSRLTVIVPIQRVLDLLVTTN